MKPFFQIVFPVLFLLLCQSCNTLYNTKFIDIEIVEPGRNKFPEKYRKIAVRYNNCNVAPHYYFSPSYFNDDTIHNSDNIDSLASKIYYNNFIDALQKQNFFTTITELAPEDYSNTRIKDTISYSFHTSIDSILKNEELSTQLKIYNFSSMLTAHPDTIREYTQEKYLHRQTGLYTPADLKKIALNTDADLLLSLDFFSSIDGINYPKDIPIASEIVLTNAYWNFYDLNAQKFTHSNYPKDTIMWSEYITLSSQLNKVIPPRRDAVLNAAEIAGTNYAHYLIPHWVQVQRMYYGSGHVELKLTEQHIKNGKWLEAAKIWKANSSNPNKNIAAKCKFNMALICELMGSLDAALEWVVKSYHTLGNSNELHADNCNQYIRILSQRKHDMRILENQMSFIDE